MVVHIIFRSGGGCLMLVQGVVLNAGLCVSMLVGYLFGGKRYSLGQVVSPSSRHEQYQPPVIRDHHHGRDRARYAVSTSPCAVIGGGLDDDDDHV